MIGFGREDNEEKQVNYDSYKEKWVLVSDGNIFSGKVLEVYSNRILLMPYYARNPRGGRDVHEIVREGMPCMIPLNEKTAIRETTEASTQEQCNIQNKEISRILFLAELDFRQRIKNLCLDETFSDGAGI